MDTPCIEWAGALSESGYGRAYDPKRQRTVKAHRKVYEDAYGPIPQGKVIMHKCDNRRCVNVHHLELGTQAQNIQDMHNKGRHSADLPKGCEHHMTTLTLEEALYIKRNAKPGNYRDLGRRFKVSRVTVKNIATGRTWAHLSKEIHDLA